MRPRLKPKYAPEPQLWRVEAHSIVAFDKEYEAASIEEVRELLQHLADGYRPTAEKPALGQLTFRYEHDKHDRINVIHALFTNRHSKLHRFARLRRIA